MTITVIPPSESAIDVCEDTFCREYAEHGDGDLAYARAGFPPSVSVDERGHTVPTGYPVSTLVRRLLARADIVLRIDRYRRNPVVAEVAPLEVPEGEVGKRVLIMMAQQVYSRAMAESDHNNALKAIREMAELNGYKVQRMEVTSIGGGVAGMSTGEILALLDKKMKTVGNSGGDPFRGGTLDGEVVEVKR